MYAVYRVAPSCDTAYTVKSSPLQEQLQGLILAVCRHRAFALTLRNSSLTGPRKTGSRPGPPLAEPKAPRVQTSVRKIQSSRRPDSRFPICMQ